MQALTVPRIDEICQAAESYYTRGWQPLPLCPSVLGNPDTGKAPPKWMTDWTTEFVKRDEFAAALVADGGTDYNLGVVTGRPSSTVVLDVDEAKALERLKAAYPEALATLTQRRSNAEPWRVHLYFSIPAGEACKSVKKSKDLGFDLLADGSSCTVPPSVHHTGGKYQWINPDAPLLPWRPEYLEALGVPKAVPAVPKPDAEPGDPEDEATIREALEYIDANCGYSDWVKVGQAIHSWTTADTGLILWDEWSQPGKTYRPGECARKWQGFKPDGGVTLGTLVHLAKEGGFKPKAKAPRQRLTSLSGTGTDPVEAAKAGQPYECTDLGNARRLVARFGTDLRYDVADERWLVWDGKRWEPDATGAATRKAKDVVQRIKQEAAQCPDKSQADALWKWSFASQSAGRIAAMLTLAWSESGIPVEKRQLDADGLLFNCANGTIELKTGQVREHRREDMITKLSPYGYDPGATDQRWTDLIMFAAGDDPEVADSIQRAVGYSMTGNTSEECLFMLLGPTAGGKTTFIEAVRTAMGDYAGTIDPEHLARQREPNHGANEAVATLRGTRFVSGSETEHGREFSAALLKQLTGYDMISARLNYGHQFQFRPEFKLWIACNHAPRMDSRDEALWRRVFRIGFTRSVPVQKRDKTLKPHLTDPKAGGPAVLAWMVEGCRKWHAMGLNRPKALDDLTQELRKSCDPLAEFFADRLETGPAVTVGTSFTDIWAEYEDWCRENGQSKCMVGYRTMREALVASGATPATGTGGKRSWKGVSIRAELPVPKAG